MVDYKPTEKYRHDTTTAQRSHLPYDTARKGGDMQRPRFLDDKTLPQARDRLLCHVRRSARSAQGERRRRQPRHEDVLPGDGVPPGGQYGKLVGSRPHPRDRRRARRAMPRSTGRHPARSRRQHQALPSLRTQFRVFFRRSLSRRQDGRRLHQRRRIDGRRHIAQTLCSQQQRISAHDDQQRRRRARSARDLSVRVRRVRKAGQTAHRDGVVQPHQRRIRDGQPVAARHPFAQAMGI